MPITADTDKLVRLVLDLDPKVRLRAIKTAFRRAGKQIRDKAVQNLRQGLASSKELEKGIRTVVWKKKAGFRVTIGTKRGQKATEGKKAKKSSGYYLSRRRNTHGAQGDALESFKKPVLIWAELGTKERMTKGNGGKRSLRLRSAHPTGKMRPYAFLGNAETEMIGDVTNLIRSEVIRSYLKAVEKYG